MAGAIRCEQAVERLWRFLDGALDAADHAEVERHLTFCLRCCGELEFARELRSKLAATSVPRIPDDTRDRLVQLIADLDEPAGRPPEHHVNTPPDHPTTDGNDTSNLHRGGPT